MKIKSMLRPIELVAFDPFQSKEEEFLNGNVPNRRCRGDEYVCNINIAFSKIRKKYIIFGMTPKYEERSKFY